MDSETRQALKDMEGNIKAHFSDVIKPIIKDVADHEIALSGLDKRSGLTGDMNKAFGSIRGLKWLLALVTVVFAVLGYYK